MIVISEHGLKLKIQTVHFYQRVFIHTIQNMRRYIMTVFMPQQNILVLQRAHY